MCTYAIIHVVSINHLLSLYSHAIPPSFLVLSLSVVVTQLPQVQSLPS